MMVCLKKKMALHILTEVAKQQTALTQYLCQHDIISSEQILDCCARHFALPIFDLSHFDSAILEEKLIKADVMIRERLLPLYREDNILYLGLSDPTNFHLIPTISFHVNLQVRGLLVSETKLEKILQDYSQTQQLHSQVETVLAKIALQDKTPQTKEVIEPDDEPIIQFVDQLIEDAIVKSISDIHIEPFETHCRVRYRRDGLLYEAATLPSLLAMRVTSRLKIMANLNIAERRLPQDGRIHLHSKSKIDIRLNTCPTLFGEKIVLRIFDANNMEWDIDNLGLLASQKIHLLQALNQPQGLVLVTGPTGSGKTFTLYSALHYLNQIEKNIASVEDPVEIEFPGINQVHVNPKIGLDFATTLRTFLRQDPDILMIGEIRDIDTATIAMQAAQTGHLVLSTLHTNNASETLSRLLAMGVPSYYLTSSLSLIIAQRLLRKLCNYCKQPEILPAEICSNTTKTSLISYRAVGCKHCHQGYHGRIGIFETLPITEKFISGLVTHDVASTRLTNHLSLWEAGLEQIKNGITSFAELNRVVEKEKC